MTNIIQDTKVQETFKRFTAEIQNKTFAQAYLAMKECISQKEYCNRVGLNESRFSRILTKIENEQSGMDTVSER